MHASDARFELPGVQSLAWEALMDSLTGAVMTSRKRCKLLQPGCA